MNARGKLTCLVVAVALIASGVLAPISAAAQSQSGQPDMSQQALEASSKATEHDQAYRIGAGVATAFSAPGRAILCGIGGVTGVVVMLLTFGTGYGAAKAVAEEGCRGPWVVTPDDLREANAHRGIKEDSYLK